MLRRWAGTGEISRAGSAIPCIGHPVMGQPKAARLPAHLDQPIEDLCERGETNVLNALFPPAGKAKERRPNMPLGQFTAAPREALTTCFIQDTDGKTASDTDECFRADPRRMRRSRLTNGADMTENTDFTADPRSHEQLLRSVLAASSDCIKVLSLDGRLIYMSKGGHLIMEVPPDVEVNGRVWADLWGAVEQNEATKALDVVRAGGNAVFQGYAETFAGNRRFWDVRVTPMLDPAGVPERILVVSRDISYLKKIEEERAYLALELSHRLKNAFSIVQSVIGQTLRRATSVDEGRRVLSDRVRALAAAQDILTQSHSNVMSIDAVIAAALAPYDHGDGRFVVGGPSVMLTGRQGLGLSLALHELATNASKYGALSTSDGTITVTWDLLEDGAFSFGWTELDGPSANPPTEHGFGTIMVRQIVATYFDGTATLDFPASGAVFRLIGNIGPGDADQT